MAKHSKMPLDDDSKPPDPPRRSSDSTDTISNIPTAPSSQNDTASTSRGGTPSPTGRDDDVTGPSPITPFTHSPGINPATPPQAPLSTFRDSVLDSNIAAVPASQGMQPDVSPRKPIMSRGAPGAIIDDGLGFLAPTNRSNTPQLYLLTTLSQSHQLLRDHPSAYQSDWLGNTSTVKRMRIMAVDRTRYLGIWALCPFRTQMRWKMVV
jgi:hypothetical protein